MALECVCYPVVEARAPVGPQAGRECHDPVLAARREPLDLCEIVERTRLHEQTKHDDRECHDRGEVRQNVINKLKMFLDDCDDRPVLRRGGTGSTPAGAGGRSGFGPMIKYPGYVDYDHPYFSRPYDRMPELAATVAQRGGPNPCPPISVRNWDQGKGGAPAPPGAAGRPRQADVQAKDCCRCAQRRGVSPECPATCKPTSGAGATGVPAANYNRQPRQPAATGPLPAGGLRYVCVPLPRD